MKAPKPEPEKPVIPKRPAEAKDAREYAKKLIKSGAINVISKTQKRPEQTTTFKRPRGNILMYNSQLKRWPYSIITQFNFSFETHFNKFIFKGVERKLISDKTVSNYQPFSAVQAEESNAESSETRTPRIKNLYDTFVTARDREERGITEKREKPDKPRTGNTIYVSGYKISEEFLKKHFSSIGNIVNVSMEIEKK